MSLFETGNKRCAGVPVREWDSAARIAGKMGEKFDVYFGCGLLDPSFTDPEKRGGYDQIIALGALWGEFDVAGAGHRRKSLPANVDDVRCILSRGPRPSIVVHSGGGYHVYWLLRSMWYFADAEDKARAAALVRRFQAVYIANAAVHGWDVDKVHDLARILRVPGTVNRKEGMARPVRIIAWHPERRYSVDEIQAGLPSEAPTHDANSNTKELTSPNVPMRRYAGESGGKSVIDAFNEAHSVEAILRTHGYRKVRTHPKGDVASLWLAPTSESKLPGVKVFSDGRVFSHHASDPLHGEHSHDAFSLFTVLGHRGNATKAVQAAADALGMVGKNTPAEPGLLASLPRSRATLDGCQRREASSLLELVGRTR